MKENESTTETPSSAPDGSIRPLQIVEAMQRSYLNYAMSVIVSRALPDIRDGLKPVHRRILYAMHRLSLHYSSRFSKSAKVVGEVLGKYHPHGDAPVYDALVRMAQTFSMRYPLIFGQGNFGSLDGDPPAAMRYTEVKLARIADEILADIDKNTVAWTDNFDATLKEPLYMPSRLPNLLLMGAEGIAVGMATRIPPHNLSEVVDGLCAMIDTTRELSEKDSDLSPSIVYSPPTAEELDPFTKEKKTPALPQNMVIEADLETLMTHIKGPDFPTGGNIYGIEEVKSAYGTGKGKIMVRATCDEEETNRGRTAIIVKEIPYQVNKATLITKIADLVKLKKIDGIHDLRDESDQRGVRIVIELKRDAAYNKVLNNLFTHTDLQTTYPANMVALIGISPQTVSLRTILESYLKHRVDVIKKRSLFDLSSARHRAHILEGLLKALDHIDEIIVIIKKSPDEATAKQKLISKFAFTDIQAQAILDMQLKRLTGLERAKIEAELKELMAQIEKLKKLLENVKNILVNIKQELLELKEKYGDGRRTKIFKYAPGKFSEEQLIENKEVIITITGEDYIKSVPRETFKVQHRGGKGVTGFDTKEDDNVSHIAAAMTHDSILFFTNLGKTYSIRCWEIPQVGRSSKGKAMVNILPIQPGETITAMLAFDQEAFKKNENHIIMCTKSGVVKKTQLSQFGNVRSSGIIAIKLDAGDQMNWVGLVSGQGLVVIASREGKSIVFKEKDVRPTGRSTRGVIGIGLAKGDSVISMNTMELTEKDKELLVLFENGIGKKTKVSLFPLQRRGGKGVKIGNLDERTGQVAYCDVVAEDKEMLIVTSAKGQVVKMPVKTIPLLSRSAKGVILMRFSKSGDKVVSATFL